MITDIKDFVTTFNKIAVSKSEETVFSDFLDISICCLSAGKYEEEYLSIIKKYKKEEVELLCELFAQMLLVMDNDGQGLTDCLGEFFQRHLSRGKHGQFFTPEHVSDFMAQINMDENTTADKTIMDPCCGSGRMLLSAAKVNRNNYFYGADIDERCAKMTAINLCLNGLQGEVAWMDSLTTNHWGGYSIKYKYGLVSVITKLAANEGILCNAGPFDKSKAAEKISNVITVSQAKLDL